MVPGDTHVWLSAPTKHEPKPLPNILRVSYREGGAGIPPPPQEILKLIMVIIVVLSILAIYRLLDIHLCHQNAVWKVCPRLRQKQSEMF